MERRVSEVIASINIESSVDEQIAKVVGDGIVENGVSVASALGVDISSPVQQQCGDLYIFSIEERCTAHLVSSIYASAVVKEGVTC
jgi:hypothetical protein